MSTKQRESETPQTDEWDNYYHLGKELYRDIQGMERDLLTTTKARDEALAKLKLYESEGMGDWTIDRVADLYYQHDGAGLIDFIVDHMLCLFNDRLGKHGWERYESDGTIDEALSYEVNQLLFAAGVISDEDYSVTHETLKKERDEALAEIARLKERVGPIDPGGGDMIDELESANGFLKHERDEALAACGQMRAALERIQITGITSCEQACENSVLNEDQHKANCFIHRALSSQHGQGWKSPEEVKALEEDRDSWERQSERLDEHNDKLRLEVVALRAEVDNLKGKLEISPHIQFELRQECATALSRATAAEEKCGRLLAAASWALAQASSYRDVVASEDQDYAKDFKEAFDTITEFLPPSQPESVGVPQQAASGEEKLPIGTRIRFLKQLTAPANEDHPDLIFANKGEIGEITSHGSPVGYYGVKRDGWPAFGASRDEFEVAPAHPQSSNDKATIKPKAP